MVTEEMLELDNITLNTLDIALVPSSLIRLIENSPYEENQRSEKIRDYIFATFTESFRTVTYWEFIVKPLYNMIQ